MPIINNYNHRIKIKRNFDGVPLTGYVASEVIFRFCARNQKQHFWNINQLMTLEFDKITNM